MTTFKLLGAAAALAFIASPASAQPVIQDPQLTAFYHPEASLGLGYSMPSAEARAMAPRPVMRHPIPARRVRPAR
jgi:hypothetical protein